MNALDLVAIVGFLCLLPGCVRGGFQARGSDASQADATAVKDGEAGSWADSLVDDARLDATLVPEGGNSTVFADDFDRGDTTVLGPDWVESSSPGSDFVIQSKRLVWIKGKDYQQDMIWHAAKLGTVDQWACFRFIDADSPYTVVSIGFRGHPAGAYVALSPHSEAYPPPDDHQVRYEKFFNNGQTGEFTPYCYQLNPGLLSGEWVCGAIAGGGSSATVRFWRFAGTPPADPAGFPAPDCTWSGAYPNEDLDGEHVGIGVWSSDVASGSSVTMDSFRGGPLP